MNSIEIEWYKVDSGVTRWNKTIEERVDII